MLAIECMSHTSLQKTGRTFSLVTIEFQFIEGILLLEATHMQKDFPHQWPSVLATHDPQLI